MTYSNDDYKELQHSIIAQVAGFKRTRSSSCGAWFTDEYRGMVDGKEDVIRVSGAVHERRDLLLNELRRLNILPSPTDCWVAWVKELNDLRDVMYSELRALHRQGIEERALMCLNNTMGPDATHAVVWYRGQVPMEIKDLSTNGGDEDWFMVYTDSFTYGQPSWAEEGSSFGCCCVEEHVIGDYTVLIGCHS
jgi:hypothetical protein